MNIAIDIASDFVCPWCFIGKRYLATALNEIRVRQPEARFQLNWLPFFLNPDTPPQGEPYQAFLEGKFGGPTGAMKVQMSVADAGRLAGVEFDFARIRTRPNTLRAHRLVYRAQSTGHRPAEVNALVERLFAAHFQHGEDIGDIETLADIAAECGDRREAVVEFLESGESAQQVKSLVGKVVGMGVTSVPFFIVQRRLTVSGAQSAEILAAAIMQGMEGG